MLFQVEICNWDKYNPRSDAKAWSWFRFQADFFGDEDLRDLPGSHLLVFVYLCCKRARSREKLAAFKLRHCAAAARTTEEDAQQAIHTFAARGLIVLHEMSRTDPNADERERTDPYESESPRTDPFPTDVTDVRTDDDLSRPSGSPAAEKGDKPRALLDAWNQHRGILPAAKGITTKRRPKITARLREGDLDYWVATIRRLAASSFATGKNDRGWKADFGWLVENDENHTKVNEGKYDDRKAAATSGYTVLTEKDLDEL